MQVKKRKKETKQIHIGKKLSTWEIMETKIPRNKE